MHEEDYFGSRWEDQMKQLAYDQQQLTMSTYGQLHSSERSSEWTELTFGQMLALDKKLSNESFGQALAAERKRETFELTFGQMLALERRRESSELTFGQLLAHERNLELQLGQLKQVANDKVAGEIQMNIEPNPMEIEQCMTTPLQSEFELHPPSHVETQDDSDISHVGTDEVCEWVILNSMEEDKEEVTTTAEKIETSYHRLRLC